jgi:SAM-dependent methyltransferase
LRKLAAGLPLGGEAVWPGLRNDLFVAHESIYRFAATWAPGSRVLDAACGTGYGSSLLVGAGAASVVGVDRNRWRVGYARRTFRSSALTYEVGDCEALRFDEDSFELVVSSNTMEHLAHPERFLAGVARALTPSGRLLVAVPPLYSDADLALHSDNEAHLSNLSLRGWHGLFAGEGWSVRLFSHRCERPLDFASHAPSSVAAGEFRFVEESLDAAYRHPALTAVFELTRNAVHASVEEGA